MIVILQIPQTAKRPSKILSQYFFLSVFHFAWRISGYFEIKRVSMLMGSKWGQWWLTEDSSSNSWSRAPQLLHYNAQSLSCSHSWGAPWTCEAALGMPSGIWVLPQRRLEAMSPASTLICLWTGDRVWLLAGIGRAKNTGKQEEKQQMEGKQVCVNV